MKTILTKKQIENKILRISFQIIENNLNEKEMFLVGLEKNGFIIAKKIEKHIVNKSNIKVKTIKMSLNKEKYQKSTFSEKISSDNKTIILIDNSLSMRANDLKPNRIVKALDFASIYLRKENEMFYSLMTFSDFSKVALKINLPILPKPLIPTFIIFFSYI